MRKTMLLMALLMCVAIPVAAQHKCKDKEAMRREVREFKMKFLAQEMDLKEDQQKQFFEVYTQMSEEKTRTVSEARRLEKKLAASKDASEAEYEAVSKAITEAKEKDAEIEKRYDGKFAQFLTPKQIFRMKAAEEKFRDKIHEMRHKKRSARKADKQNGGPSTR
ncbi:MAG: hypothetical protein K2L57_05210 [Muribaculaceae bacterium]|nr:hypothetical protein [Muribaculaceae bacterium]